MAYEADKGDMMNTSWVKRIRFLPFVVALTVILTLASACQGVIGPQGAQGAQGNQGPQGAQGWQGDSGAAATDGQVKAAVVAIIQPVVGQLGGSQGNQGPIGPAGPVGPQGEAGTALGVGAGVSTDKAAYVLGVDSLISVYGSGFQRKEYVLPQIAGGNPRGFKAAGVNANMDGVFSTTIALNTSGHMVTAGVYSLSVTGGDGTLVTIPIVLTESTK